MLTTLLLSIAGGMLGVLSMACPEQIAWKFHRLVGFICFALTVGTFAWFWRSEGDVPGGTRSALLVLIVVSAIVAMVLIFFAPSNTRFSRLFRLLCALGGVTGIAAACVLTWSAQFVGATGSLPAITKPSPSLASPGFVLTVIGQTLGSLFLGSITLAWLLGHAYLTATRMTIDPLRRFTRLLMWFVNARLVFVAVSLLIAWWMERRGEQALVLEHFTQAWIIAILHVGVGLILVSVFAWMVNDCVRLRATQSATGILYFASVAAYVGELAGLQLMRECHWPL